MFDLELIKNYYDNLDKKITSIRRVIDKPLTLSENIVEEVISTYNWNTEKEFERFMRFATRHANSQTNT